MGKKSNYIDRKKHAFSKNQSIVAGDHKSGDFVKSDRIEWLKQLYAEWLEKRNFVLKNNKEIYLISELDESEIEVYWKGL